MTNRRAKLALIHVAKQQLALDDQSYRALLAGAAGVRSAADLTTDVQHRAVMDAFARLGFASSGAPRRRRPANAQFGKCYALWCALYECGAVKSKRYASMMRYVQRMVGAQDIYREDQLSMVIESLKRWLARASAKAVKTRRVEAASTIREGL